MPSSVAHLLADLSRAFDTIGVRWYVFGAQAAIVHGAARLTADVDVTVRLPDGVSTETLASTVEQSGFQRRFSDPEFMARTRVAPFVHTATGLPADLVIGGPGLEEYFLARAELRDFEGTRVPVASAEDVIVMKVLAGRAKDIDDIRAIVAAQGEALDLGYARDTVSALESALGQSDLRPIFEDAVRRDT